MRTFVVVLLCFINTSIFAQDQYEVFGVDGKYGVVEIATLNEFIPSKYEKWDNIFSDITLVNGSNYTFIDRKTGKSEEFIITDNSLRFNESSYKLFEKDGKSVFIPKDVSKKIFYNKKYTKAIGLGLDLIVGDAESFDVYVHPNFKTAKFKNIAAINVYYGIVFRKSTQKEERLIIFYGKDVILVYDVDFKLLKKYESDETNESRMFDTIASDFTQVFSPVRKLIGPKPRYFESEDREGSTIIKNREKGMTFSVKGEFFVGSAISYEPSWVELNESKTSKRYMFKVDFEKKQFLLPQKYIDTLELKFL